MRPPLDADKGTAVRRLLTEAGIRRALYAGDDTTDLDAFRSLDGLDPAVRIAVAFGEGPAELAGEADIVVVSTAERSRSCGNSDARRRDRPGTAPEALRRARLLRWEGEVTDPELALITYSPGRRHDVTLFVFNGPRLALIRKPHFTEGIWRTPGGGIKPGEDFVAGVVREALEELGVQVELDRYLVRAEAVFRFADQAVPWRTHVFAASTSAEELSPLDTDEIEAARWGTAEELGGPIRERCSPRGGRSGATGSRSTTPRSPRSVPPRRRPRSEQAASRRSTAQARRTSASVVRSLPTASRST